jgi:5-methylcytosine-specific restriction endonuclease McrA
MADEEVKHVSRQEAIAAGLKVYWTGKPCRKGHLAARRLAGNACAVCAKESLRKWKDKNRDYVRTRDRSYQRKTQGRRNELERARYENDPERFRRNARNKYAKNSVVIREKRKKYHYETYTQEEVRKKAQARTKQWALENPDWARRNAKVSNHKRRAKAVGSFTADDIAAIFKSQRGKCAYCRKKVGDSYHVDHIVPIARGGPNVRSNLQITCAACNRAKAARDPIEHARSLGMLI